MMTDEQLREIEERAERATEGPWAVVVKGNTVQSRAIPGVCAGISPKTGNASFIAHARTDVPAMVAEIRRLRAIEEAAREVVDAMPVGVACDWCARFPHSEECVIGNLAATLRSER